VGREEDWAGADWGLNCGEPPNPWNNRKTDVKPMMMMV